MVFVGLAISYFSPFVHPQSIWWVSFFGLAYPIFFVLSLFLLILSFWRKWRFRYLYLIILTLGIPIHNRFFAWSWSQDLTEEEQKKSITLMSYNVRLFDWYNLLPMDKFKTRNLIYNQVREVAPDVLCFQEYLRDNTSNPFVSTDAIKKLANYTNFHEEVIWEVKHRYYGIATFSKYPIIQKGVLNDEVNNRLMCIYTDLIKNKDTIRVYNLHLQSIKLESSEYSLFDDLDLHINKKSSNLISLIRKVKNAYPPRVKQVEKILAHINESPHPVIICGDFNDTPISYVYNLFSTRFTDAFRKAYFGLGRTYAGRVPAGRIDYIFHSNRLQTYRFNIQKEVLSDHLAIWATIGW